MKGIKCQVCGEPFNRYSWKSQQETCPECLKKPRQKTQAVSRLKSGKHHEKYTANTSRTNFLFRRKERKKKDPQLYEAMSDYNHHIGKERKKFYNFPPRDIFKKRIYEEE